jgi:polyhydroxyalkanoate synthesis regulator phasin
MSEQNGQFNQFGNNGNAMPDFMNYWMATLGTLSWSQEQAENLAVKMIEQHRLTKDEGKRIMEEMVSQVRQNQEQLLKMIREGIQATFASFNSVTQAQLDDLKKRLDELAAKLENR